MNLSTAQQLHDKDTAYVTAMPLILLVCKVMQSRFAFGR